MSHFGIEPGSMSQNEMHSREPIPYDDPPELDAMVDRLTTMAAEQAEWIDRMSAAGIAHLNDWPGGFNPDGTPKLCRENDLAASARIDNAKPVWLPVTHHPKSAT